MVNNNQSHHRQSIRLKGYDYTSPGAYFVTLVTWQREPVFGEVIDGKMVLNEIGRIVREDWEKTEKIRKEITLDTFVIMPNHLHGIVWIEPVDESDIQPIVVGAHGRAPLRKNIAKIHRQSKSLGAMIAGFKSAATKRVNQHRGLPGHPLWQRNYYDHIIRSQKELNNIRNYIKSNPLL
ncbi:MAG: hypothetical protein PVI99_09040 [Anaerolineales bacterium]|jgi:REP element-mobilizing transposase RayT